MSKSATETETETETSVTATTTETETTDSDGSESTGQMYSTDTDGEEEEAKDKAKKGGVSDDPFERRVPKSFYDKEKKKFGPLPKNWEVGMKGKKPYYADHQAKTTTWVDPRTKDTRIHDIMKCKLGELPYGWDEEVDPEVGVYYIDHNTQSTYLDPPWDPRIQFQVRQLQNFLAEQIELYKQKVAELQTATEIAGKDKDEELRDALNERERLKRELEELKKKREEESESEESESEDDVEVPKTLAEFQDRLKELNKLQGLLNSAGQDELEEYKKTQQDIEEINRMLLLEEEARKKILEDIERLKGDLNTTEEPPRLVPEEEPLLRPLQTSNEIANQPARKAQLTRRTRYEMHMELMMLKKRLQAEKLQNESLRSLQGKAVDREGSLPAWIKQMNDIASSSKTLRVKILKKQQAGGEQLSFRERMLFFSANIVENKASKAPLPPPPRRKLN